MRLASGLSFEDIMPLNSPMGKRGGFTGVLADGVALSNAIDKVDWSSSEAAIELCDYCGAPNCSGEPDVLLRNVSGYLAIIPLSLTECGWNNEEYLSTYNRSYAQGVLLTEGQCEELRRRGANVKKMSSYPTLSQIELLRCIWMSSPFGLLRGTPAHPVFECELVYACSRGDTREWTGFVERALRKGSFSDAESVSTPDKEKFLTFYIGEPFWDEWSPMCEVDGFWYMLLAERVGVRLK